MAVTVPEKEISALRKTPSSTIPEKEISALHKAPSTTIPEKAISELSEDLVKMAATTPKELLFLEISVKYPKLLRKKSETENLQSLESAKAIATRYFKSAKLSKQELEEF